MKIAPAGPEHGEALAALAEEMDRFYGATEVDPIELRVSQINDALFADVPSAHALLAWDAENLVGFASYSFLWPAVGLTRSIFLKELYVIAQARGKGIGRLLMEHLCDIAVKSRCSRLEWTTDAYNQKAQHFYAELGVPVDDSKLFYRIEGGELNRRDIS